MIHRGAPSQRPRLSLLARLLGVALFGTPSALANPADTFGWGSGATALGGAVSARVRDAAANYYNPAGLAMAPDVELSLGAVLVEPDLQLGDADAPASSVRSLQLGLVVPGKIAQVPVAFGMATQIAGNRLARVLTFTEEDQGWFLYNNRPETIYLSANFAVTPLPWLSVGAGLSFLASTSGVLQISGTAVQPFGDATEFDSDLQHEVLADLESVRYPQVGIRVSPHPEWSAAFVYRGEGQVHLDVDSDIRGELEIVTLRIPLEYLLVSRTVQSFVPSRAVLGVAGSPLPELSVGMDVEWVNWSAFPSPVSATVSSLVVDAPALLGVEVPELPPATELENAGLEDRFNVRLGAEYLLQLNGRFALPLRAGYAAEPTPLGDDSSLNLVDADRHTLSIGAGAHWTHPSAMFPGKLTLDLHALLGLFESQAIATIGDSNQAQTASGRFFAVGATVSYGFASGGSRGGHESQSR